MDLVDRHHHGTAVTGYSAQNIDNIIHQVHCYIDLQQCSAENFVLSNKYGTYKYLHCKSLQGFTGTLQGNRSVGISNLRGLHVYPQSL